jgi:hypothetical protein
MIVAVEPARRAALLTLSNQQSKHRRDDGEPYAASDCPAIHTMTARESADGRSSEPITCGALCGRVRSAPLRLQ